MSFGDADTPVAPDTVLDAIRKRGTNVAVNLLGSAVNDRPEMLAAILTAVLDIRAKYGRPHWIFIDEAHHMLPRDRDAGAGINLDAQMPTIFVTVHPDTLASGVLRSIGTVLLIGRDSLRLEDVLAKTLGKPCPPLPDRGPDVGEALYWACGSDEAPLLIRTEKPKGDVKRHTRKYAQGTLGEDRSFFFRGPDERLNIRAYNLGLFLDISDGVDPETYLFHLRRGDFAAWLRTSIKNNDLADEVENIEANDDLGITEVRQLIRTAVEQRYTASADPK